MLINAQELVVGDVVKLSTGDKTPGKFYNNLNKINYKINFFFKLCSRLKSSNGQRIES